MNALLIAALLLDVAAPVCVERAEAAYYQAERTGSTVPDAAYEDAFEACEAGQ